jgi:hypothetical protein
MLSYQQAKALSEALKADLESIEAQIEEIQYKAEGFSLKKQEENTQPGSAEEDNPDLLFKENQRKYQLLNER